MHEQQNTLNIELSMIMYQSIHYPVLNMGKTSDMTCNASHTLETET